MSCITKKLGPTGTGDLDQADSCRIPRGPAIYNIYAYQGDTWKKTIKWESLLGAPAFDLTGATILFQVRAAAIDNEPDLLFEASIGDGITLTDPSNAIFDIELIPDKTVLLSGRRPFYYDLEITLLSGQVYTIMRGKVFYDLEVSRA